MFRFLAFCASDKHFFRDAIIFMICELFAFGLVIEAFRLIGMLLGYE